MARVLKWLREVLRFMCLNYILPMFVFLVVNLISGNSKIAFVFFSITLIAGIVMNFRELDRSIYDKNGKPLDSNWKPVERRDPESHIRIKEDKNDGTSKKN